MRRLREIWVPLKHRAEQNFPRLRGLRLKHCVEADREHAESPRQFMHNNHRGDHLLICYASAAERLSANHQVGLLVHEIGHALAFALGCEDHSESQADQFGLVATAIKVQYRTGLNLQWSRVPTWLRLSKTSS